MAKLFWASLKMLYRDKQAIFWALAFPVIFAVVFGLFDFGQAPEVRIDVVGRPSTVYEGILSGLRKVDSFDVRELSASAEARTRLSEGDVDVVIEVGGFGQVSMTPGQEPIPPGAHLRVFYNEANFETNQFALSTIERLVDGMNLRMAGVERPPITVDAEGVAAKSVDYYDFLLPGLVAMGVMNFSITGIAVAVTRFREQRILKRILATPLRPVRFLSAQVLARLVLAVVQSALILAVGVFLFGARIYGNVTWLFVLTTVANLVFLNIGFAIAGRAKNPDAATGVANAVALPMMFLSGVFFPTDTLPSIMQTVVKYLPLTPLIEALRKVSIDGLSITDTGPQLALLGIWIAVSFALAAMRFRFSEG
jgi:ABC-2 type transport system permease protein